MDVVNAISSKSSFSVCYNPRYLILTPFDLVPSYRMVLKDFESLPFYAGLPLHSLSCLFISS